jgi:hypothetical protein
MHSYLAATFLIFQASREIVKVSFPSLMFLGNILAPIYRELVWDFVIGSGTIFGWMQQKPNRKDIVVFPVFKKILWRCGSEIVLVTLLSN